MSSVSVQNCCRNASENEKFSVFEVTTMKWTTLIQIFPSLCNFNHLFNVILIHASFHFSVALNEFRSVARDLQFLKDHLILYPFSNKAFQAYYSVAQKFFTEVSYKFCNMRFFWGTKNRIMVGIPNSWIWNKCPFLHMYTHRKI